MPVADLGGGPLGERLDALLLDQVWEDLYSTYWERTQSSVPDAIGGELDDPINTLVHAVFDGVWDSAELEHGDVVTLLGR